MSKTKSIMDFFPYATPREAQIEILTSIEKYWESFDAQ
jgi:hypothetical protein